MGDIGCVGTAIRVGVCGGFANQSNTARRNIHQLAYTESFDAADEVLLANLCKTGWVSPKRYADVDRLVREISSRGTPARPSDVDGVLNYLLEHTG